MDENGYEFMKYEKTIGSYSSLTSVGNCSSAYSIIDKNNNVVAAVYCVQVSGITIDNGFSVDEKTGVAYVAISTTTNQIIDMSLVKVPFVGDYHDKVNGAVNDFDYANNNILDQDPKVFITNATWSAKGIKNLAQAAVDVYQGEYKA